MERRISSRIAVVAGALAFLLAGCASGGTVGTAATDSEAACAQAYAQAAATDPASDTANGLDGAIASCSSLEAWVAAATRYPDTTAGQYPAAYAAARCEASTDLKGAAVCQALAARGTP